MEMKCPCLFWCLLSIICLLSCTREKDKNELMMELFHDFAQTYPTFSIPELRLNYKENLEQIQPLDSLERQADFFGSIQDRLQQLPLEEIDSSLVAGHKILAFITQLNLERIQLSYDFLKIKDKRAIDWENGLYFIPFGKEWYRYFLKIWLGAAVEPQELTNVGMEDLKEVQQAIQAIQNDLGFGRDTLSFYEHLNSPQFFESGSRNVKKMFEERKSLVRQHLWTQFSEWELPEEKIEKGQSAALSQVPGYYMDEETTFYFNLFDQPFNTRQVDFLYLHEAVPGHHFQISLEKSMGYDIPDYMVAYNANGYREGWAAYVEEIGAGVGLYRTPYDWLGKHEWDIVRCARVVMDVGINYRGWSDEKALSFWKTHIDNQDNIAMREIQRMRRWPAQVHTYKYGAAQILELRAQEEAHEGEHFDVKSFHDKILHHGPLPWEVLKYELQKTNHRLTKDERLNNE